MDTHDLFKNNATSADVLGALTTRYNDPTCLIFNTELSNMWNNFYKKKNDVINPVKTRSNQAKIDSDAVIGTVPLFKSVQTNINKDFS